MTTLYKLCFIPVFFLFYAVTNSLVTAALLTALVGWLPALILNEVADSIAAATQSKVKMLEWLQGLFYLIAIAGGVGVFAMRTTNLLVISLITAVVSYFIGKGLEASIARKQ